MFHGRWHHARSRNACLHGMQTKKLHHEQEQKNESGSHGVEEVLQVLQQSRTSSRD